MYLTVRGLPALITTSSTTSTTTSSSSSTTTTSSSSSASSGATSTSQSTSNSITSAPSSSSSSSSSHLSTSTVHATVVIPNQKNVPYAYNYPGTIDGTVYIAFGSVLGFLLFLIVLIWSILSFKSWYEARRQKNYRNTLKQNYNNPLYTHTDGNSDYFTNDSFKDEMEGPSSSFSFSSSPSSSSSSHSPNNPRSSTQSSNHVSDISEKLLKQKHQQRDTDRLMVRKSFVFNNNNHNNNNNNNSNGNSNNASNGSGEFQGLFVSPTEVLFSGNKFTHSHENSFSNTTLSLPSTSSSPMHTFGIFPNGNGNGSVGEGAATPSITINSSGTSVVTDTLSPLGISNMHNNNNSGNVKTKRFRPPSVHLDLLLDQQ